MKKNKIAAAVRFAVEELESRRLLSVPADVGTVTLEQANVEYASAFFAVPSSSGDTSIDDLEFTLTPSVGTPTIWNLGEAPPVGGNGVSMYAPVNSGVTYTLTVQSVHFEDADLSGYGESAGSTSGVLDPVVPTVESPFWITGSDSNANDDQALAMPGSGHITVAWLPGDIEEDSVLTLTDNSGNSQDIDLGTYGVDPSITYDTGTGLLSTNVGAVDLAMPTANNPVISASIVEHFGGEESASVDSSHTVPEVPAAIPTVTAARETWVPPSNKLTGQAQPIDVTFTAPISSGASEYFTIMRDNLSTLEGEEIATHQLITPTDVTETDGVYYGTFTFKDSDVAPNPDDLGDTTPYGITYQYTVYPSYSSSDDKYTQWSSTTSNSVQLLHTLNFWSSHKLYQKTPAVGAWNNNQNMMGFELYLDGYALTGDELADWDPSFIYPSNGSATVSGATGVTVPLTATEMQQHAVTMFNQGAAFATGEDYLVVHWPHGEQYGEDGWSGSFWDAVDAADNSYFNTNTNEVYTYLGTSPPFRFGQHYITAADFGDAQYDASTNTILVNGPATLIADPETDPIIDIVGSDAVLTVGTGTTGQVFHIGGLDITDGGKLVIASVGGSRSSTNHNALIIDANLTAQTATSSITVSGAPGDGRSIIINGFTIAFGVSGSMYTMNASTGESYDYSADIGSTSAIAADLCGLLQTMITDGHAVAGSVSVSGVVLTLTQTASGIGGNLPIVNATEGALASTNWTGGTNASVFAIDGTSLMDVEDNDVIINYATGTGSSVFSTVNGLVTSGYASGAWDGYGINSSIAAGLSYTGVGVGDNALLGKSTFDGVTLDGNQILLKYTYYGDANLDGDTNFTDYLIQQDYYNGSGNWTEGDFNFNGAVNYADYLKFQLGDTDDTGTL